MLKDFMSIKEGGCLWQRFRRKNWQLAKKPIEREKTAYKEGDEKEGRRQRAKKRLIRRGKKNSL